MTKAQLQQDNVAIDGHSLLTDSKHEDVLYNPQRKPTSSDFHSTSPNIDTRDIPARYVVFVGCIFFLIIGRFTVPTNDPTCIIDKMMDSLKDVNAYILANPSVRDAMQITCSFFMDTMTLATLFYWIYRGNGGRLIIATALFYSTRALIQMIFYMPFPEGYWWYDPGLPSLVVPYGKGSDFFFSGHAGFVVICGAEWWKNNNPYMVTFIALGGLYTMFVLVVFRIHYSIDVFAGVIVAHWCFLVVDQNKEKLDSLIHIIYTKIKVIMFKQKEEVNENKDIEQHLLSELKITYPTCVELMEISRKTSKRSISRLSL
jgi:hypothetical protein